MAEKEFDQNTLERLKKFLKDFDAKCGKDIVRMRKDREFACGDQWNEYVSTESGRPEAVFNIIDNFANAILNPFLSKPFDITYTKVDETSTPVDKINMWVKELQNEWQTKNAVETGLDAAIKCGRGFFYATNTEEKKAAIFSVDDPTMVMFDPNSTEINGSDAEQVAVVEYISRTRRNQSIPNITMKKPVETFLRIWVTTTDRKKILALSFTTMKCNGARLWKLTKTGKRLKRNTSISFIQDSLMA